MTKIIISIICFFFGIAFAQAQCVDFDGDGIADSCGSVGNIPSVPTPTRVDTGSPQSSSVSYKNQQAAPAPKKAVQHTAVPSMQTMVATTMFGSLLEAVFMEPAQPEGPSPAEIEAQRILAEQKRIEFQKSNRDLTRRLKGQTTSVEDKNMVEAGGLKLKGPPRHILASHTEVNKQPGDVFSQFFGSTGSVPTVQLLREEQNLIESRLQNSNQWAGSITQSLKTKAPPLPYKQFDELQPGDVLLVNASGSSWAIAKADSMLSGRPSDTSHTVIFLKEVKGKKHFLENTPGKGPRIIFEDEVIREYGPRGGQVAKLAQPLNNQEAKALYSAAVDMAEKNRDAVVKSHWFGTNYGAWGKDNVVCSEADWALLNIARSQYQIPATSDHVKATLGIDFSPADFYKNGQHFLVSPLDMPHKE